MAAKTWEADFRYPAIQSSLELFPNAIPDDIFTIPKSFCLPIAARPVVGFTPGKAMLVFLVVGFALLGLAVWLTSLVEKEGPFMESVLPMVVGSLCGILGVGCFFAPSLFDKQLVSMFLGDRGSELRRYASATGVRSAELSDGDLTKQAISIDGDDFVLIYMDQENRRLLIEGISARYQIRSEDVVSVEPFVFTNYIGAQICCRIDEQTDLLFAVARVSLLFEITRQLPFLKFLRKRIQNKLLEEIAETLGFAIVEG
ncbi:hypothetical protein CA13_05110 [Planctomycetes bacterium CA13]|uniref:Uncharacterized protein n=1 Tax=Novipirellula herctigrandis TaxID=2527986 RepID=A0A5C5YVQ9_9BACT|nr:hypothetical protein CA13_05110 [Planctomycetes bacterium CA13]